MRIRSAALPHESKTQYVLIKPVRPYGIYDANADVEDVIGQAFGRDMLTEFPRVKRPRHILHKLDGMTVRVFDDEAQISVRIRRSLGGTLTPFAAR